jgi:hypothetical protein
MEEIKDKIKDNIEEGQKLLSEYASLNEKVYNRNGYRMTKLEELLDKNNKEFMELVKKQTKYL